MSRKTDMGQWLWLLFAFTNFWFLIGCLWAEILTTIVWPKSVKSCWNILWTPIFVTFSAWWAGTNTPAQCGRESAHISRAASGNITLGDCTWRAQHLQGGEHQQGLGEVSWAKTVRRCFCSCANNLSMPIFWRCLDLSTLMFCRRQYFVDGNILSTAIFCCRGQCFVGANVNCVLCTSWLLLICLNLLGFDC